MPANKAASKESKKVEQKDVIWMVIVALLLGTVIGNVYAVLSGSSDDETSEITDETTDTHMAHETYEVDRATQDAPSVKLYADADPKGGWNLKIVTKNFEFTPEDVNGDDVLGTGHAHIYVDGEKLGRVYSNNYYLNALGDGDHEITVSLNTNSHADYVVDGVEVADTIEVTEVSDGEATVHEHDDGEMHVHE